MDRANLADVLIDDVTWQCATRARRAEWQHAIAELLQRHFRQVRPDHPTARRLFTLLVILTHDTTRLG